MPLLPLFEWLDANLPGTLYLRDATYGFTILLTSHVVSLCLFMGLIVMMDLRLVGIGNRRTPVTEIQKRLFLWQMLGFALTSVTGVLLLYADPLRYYPEGFFWGKLALMALAAVNALAFHLTTYRSVARWDREAPTPAAAKLAGALGLVLWAGVLVFGRLIAYDWWEFQIH